MDCCFFNSCILNDTDFLVKYKKKFTNLEGKLTKEIFISVDKNNDLIKSLDISSDLKKKYIFCDEHHKQLKDLIKIKQAMISKPDKLSKDILILLNTILKNNIDIKKLLYKMEFGKDTNIIKILMKNISYNKDKDCKLYLYLTLGQFLKEKTDIIGDKNNLEDKYEELKRRDKELFNDLNKEISDINLKVYDVNQSKVNNQINDENFLRDVILYDLCLSNVEHLIYNWNQDKDRFNPKQLIENVIDILNQVISGDDYIPYIISNELFFHIIGFINIYLISDLTEPDILNFILKFILEKNQEIYAYLKNHKDENKFKSTIRNYITTFSTILEILLRIDLSKFDQKLLEIFVINSRDFNKDKKYELLFSRNNDMIEELKDKVKLTFANKNN
jgi:hypothetical protein